MEQTKRDWRVVNALTARRSLATAVTVDDRFTIPSAAASTSRL